MFGVIMAGGGGTRLWPKSRESFPKQMHALAGAKPLVQEMAERLNSIVGESNVYVITNSHHAKIMQNVMPGMAERIMVDPYRRDTAACIGLAAVYLSKVDPNAVMGNFAADHFIGKEEKFGEVLSAAEKLASAGHVVTIGLKPTGPETGYGYIEMGDPAETVGSRTIYQVRRFVEKPDLETAQGYLDAGNYLWNSGMFVWSIPTIFSLYQRHLPEMYEKLMRIRDTIGTRKEAEVVDREYESIERISVDYGIMEKLDDILVIPGDFEWNDIGSWATVCDISCKNDDGNAVQASHICLDTKDCLIIGTEGRLVATIGVQDLVIVDTDDALLICHKDRAQDVKKIVDKLKDSGLVEYL